MALKGQGINMPIEAMKLNKNNARRLAKRIRKSGGKVTRWAYSFNLHSYFVAIDINGHQTLVFSWDAYVCLTSQES